MRCGLIGGGFMGEALVAGALKRGVLAASDVVVADPADARRDLLASSYGVGVTIDNAEAARGVELLILAVKPQEFSNVAGGLRGALNEGQTALSIMAGVPTQRIADELGHGAVVRVMPNTPASIGEAMCVWFAAPGVGKEGCDASERLLAAVGRQRRVDDEAYIDMATALSGSGPGFVFAFLEALIEGGVGAGLPRDMAQEFAVQTLAGAALLARETGRDPADLRAMVTSKGGTTAAGLKVLDDAGLRNTVSEAVRAAHERAKELS